MVHADLPNLHAVAAAHAALSELGLQVAAAGFAAAAGAGGGVTEGGGGGGGGGGGAGGALPGLLAKLEATEWLQQVHGTLSAAAKVALAVRRGQSVLVHCSDGWDRTAQVTSLASVMLCARYRTISGLAELLEREWCRMGHPLASRNRGAMAQGSLLVTSLCNPCCSSVSKSLHSARAQALAHPAAVPGRAAAAQ